MVTESVNEILDSAATYACHSGLPYIDVSLIALATLQTNEVKDFLKRSRISDQAISEEICGLLDTLNKQEKASPKERFALSPATLFVYKMGEGLARNLKKKFSPLYLLAGLTDGRPGDGHYHITQIMEKHGLNGADLYEHISYTNFIGREISPATDDAIHSINAEVKEKLAQIQARTSLIDCPMLMEVCENLMDKARSGRIDPVFGRDQEIGRTIRILSRRKKNNPILLGEPGVGKTAVAEELARLIVAGLVPKKLKDKIVLSLDLGTLVGKAKYRGELEDRLKRLIAEAKVLGNVILFIDEIHLMTGRMLDGCGELMKPALANGELTAIGATTHSEYLQYFEKDAAMARRFQPVMINEPDRDTAVEIVRGILAQYEKHHGVAFDNDVAAYAVDMSIRYNPRQFLPDKAIDLIDEAGAQAAASRSPIVTRQSVDMIIHDMAGADAAPFKPQEAARALGRKIVGQSAALEAVGRFMRAVDLRLVNGEVQGVISISGPKGSGKGHFAKCLAEATGSRLLELDGLQCQHESAIWRLLGSMPGYRDHEKGGQLTEALRRNPRTMLAIKNLELAHPEVQELVTTLISTGMITDSAKKPVSANEVYVLFLSETEAAPQIGFRIANELDDETPVRADLEELIDCHVKLGQPNESELSELLETMTKNLQTKMRKAGRDFSLADALKEFIVKTAFTAEQKITRLRQEFHIHVKSKLLSQEIAAGSSVLVELETGR
jgi:ATP-dependent Clp protease ATP-binding subunit ClpA